ncbi:MAG: type IX secretion system sortase PorU [Bacteroidota bacterium]
MNKNLMYFLAFVSLSSNTWGQTSKQVQINNKTSTLIGGFYVEKVQLSGNQLPEIKIADQEFILSGKSISDSLLNAANSFKVQIGIERKKTFALIRIPAFRKNEQGVIQQLENCTINIIEKDAQKENTASSENKKLWRTTSPASVLANGTWQKLAITKKGMYKIDYDFVKNTLGQSGNINSSSIRLFGNGGTMIYESNAVQHPDDLVENAIDIYDGGDGIFGSGDYFLFYANGPMEWVKDSTAQQFHHRTNLYSDSSYYFITFNNGSGLRMNNTPAASSPTTTVSSYNDYNLYEKELSNLGMFGKIWWGEAFGFNSGLTNTGTFSFPANNLNDSVFYSYQLANAAIGATNTAKFTVKLNGNIIGEHDNLYGISGQDGDNPGVLVQKNGLAVIPSSGLLSFQIEYQKYVSNAKGYLDFIEINTRRQLVFNSGTQMSFRDWRSVGASSVAQFQISSANSSLRVWDVTNYFSPAKIAGSLSGSTFSFSQEAKQLHEYIACDNNFLIPNYVGSVPNQNLHGLDQADYLIVSHPEMLDAANKLANFHRSTNNFRVNVVSLNQVYNEFASGSKDISAIRDFARMFYDRAGNDETKMPKYLLLLGQASFDYKNIIPNNAKLVPTYETQESLSATEGYCSDDYYAILDSNEDISTGNALMDIGIGRIPATNAAQASSVVDKIIRYKSKEALGVWRLNNIYIGDNEDNAGNHLQDADEMYKTVESTTNIYKAQKVYLDNMNFVSTPGGARCPDANKIINDNIYKGTFLMNYSGHGSIYTLAHERIITQDDYNSWHNQYKMPIMITATCDFSRFDNPALQSAGEKIILKGDGGAIALVTTTQVVYATYNRIFNTSYLHTQFTKKADGWNTFGDAFRISKNVVLASGDIVNSRKFALLGDPALTPNFPRYDVQTDSVQELIDGVGVKSDSVKSLGAYRIYGTLRNDDGNIMSGFNGKVNITFFDKPQTTSVKTENSGPGNREYLVQNNIIYKGIATVTAGRFSYEFITPKDINYEFGKGKICYYAEDGNIDAVGADTSTIVGGFSDNASVDEDAPLVRAFMNDSLFKDGGLTGTNSILYAIISDKSGINVSGNFVGHDLTAVLDDVVEAPYILNDYYETAPNTYKLGYVNFPLSGLSDGLHYIKVKAWDVFNNSGEGKVFFEVLNGKVIKIRNIYNYPNPFSSSTRFVFEHNHPNEALKVTIHIFNTAGSLVRTIDQDFTATGSNSAEVIWDGTGNGGEKLPSGVYPYRIRIATEKNIEDLGYQKVILYR